MLPLPPAAVGTPDVRRFHPWPGQGEISGGSRFLRSLSLEVAGGNSKPSRRNLVSSKKKRAGVEGNQQRDLVVETELPCLRFIFYSPIQ